MDPQNNPNPNQPTPQYEDPNQQTQSAQPAPQYNPNPTNTNSAPVQQPSAAPAPQPVTASNDFSPSQPTTQPSINPTQPVDPAILQTAQTGMFKGRLNRIGFLLSFAYVLAYFIIPVALEFLLRGNMVANVVTYIFGIVGVVLAIPIGLSITIRRWHDMNQSGWLILLGLIPFVSFILLLIYLFVPGTKTENNYGSIDSRPSTFRKVLFGK